MALITLLTDFGLDDEYVGVIKGVIAGIHTDVRTVDVTHQIDPQDVVHGAFILAAAFSFFPSGTIHVAVVDPGVGSGRRILAVEAAGHRFLAPDNGLLERVLDDQRDVKIVSVENKRYFLNPVSQTFHGRDIFAPVAAHLACGLALHQLGPIVDRQTMVTGGVPRCRIPSMHAIEGQVVAIDRFGNLLTNIDQRALEQLQHRFPGSAITVRLARQCIHGIATEYQQAAQHAPLAIVGSRGLLEISVNCGSAHHLLGVGKKDTVRVAVNIKDERIGYGES
jgi:S-adenosyl-L-methionine hydrolase (adenosine-forming)